MSSSECVSISLSIIGFLYAFVVAWIFYRAQQKTDFRSLVENLLELKTDITKMHELANSYQKINEYGANLSITGVDKLSNTLSQHSNKLVDINGTILDFQRDIESISKKIDAANLELLVDSIGKLKEKINDELQSIISEIKEKLLRDLRKVEEEIKTDIERSSEKIVSSLNKDISQLIKDADEKDALLKRIKELIQEQALSAASKQASVVNTFAENLNSGENKTINTVFEGVDKLQRNVLDSVNQLMSYNKRPSGE